MQDWKMTDKVAGVEFGGLVNDGLEIGRLRKDIEQIVYKEEQKDCLGLFGGKNSEKWGKKKKNSPECERKGSVRLLHFCFVFNGKFTAAAHQQYIRDLHPLLNLNHNSNILPIIP